MPINTTSTGASSPVPTNGATYNSLPAYYTEPAQQFSGTIQDYLDKINAPGGFSSGYSGAQVAGIDPYQTQGYLDAGGIGAKYAPYTQAGGATQLQGQDWLRSAQGYTSQDPKNSFTSAGIAIGDQYGQLGTIDPYLSQGSGALSQAGGYLAGSANYDPAQMQRHLSPYLGGVNDEIARRGNQNLNENVLPAVNSTFTGAGQFGSTRNADFSNRALRENQREILGAQSTALNQGYNQAGQDYLGWARQGQNAGQGFGALAQNAGGLGNLALDKVRTGANIGTSIGNLGGQQASYGNILGNFGDSLSGLGESYGKYGRDSTNQDWTNASNLYGVGGQLQGYNQNILNVAKQDWLDRWEKPAELIGGLSKIIPNYTNKLEADKSVYTGGPGAQNNSYADIIAAIQAYQGSQP